MLEDDDAFSALASGDTEVGVAGFAGTVYRTPHHCDFAVGYLLFALFQAVDKFLDLTCQFEEIYFGTSASRAGDDFRQTACPDQ